MADLEIRCNDVYMQCGVLTFSKDFTAGDLLSGTRIRPEVADRFAILFKPPPTDPWLVLRVEYEVESGDRIPFTARSDSHGHRVMGVKGLRFEMPIVVTVEIDTDHSGFLKLAPPGEDERLEKAITVYAEAERKAGGPPLKESKKLFLRLSPVKPMEAYNGFVAVDLGNTSTALVHLSGELNAPKQIRLVDVKPPHTNDNPEPAVSALRVLSRTLPCEADHYSECACVIGSAALAGDPPVESLFLGSKRLLADQTGALASETIEFSLNGKSQRMSRSEPAELFLTELLQVFHKCEHHFPKELILTCPTTFSRREIEQLRRAAYHALNRSRGETTRTQPTDEQLDKLIPPPIDEASAAAFHFIHDDYLDGPGRLPGFRYVFPKGINVLLFDCGGGTTDLSLIHVRAATDKLVEFEVKGRAGHRNFGGDAMTIAAYRVLKLRLAQAFPENTLSNWPDATDATALRQFLADPGNVRTIDKIIPTAFHHEQGDHESPEVRKRKLATLLLWSAAEELKKGVAASESGEVEVKDYLNEEVADALAPLIGKTATDLTSRASSIRVRAAEIDALIEADLRRCVEYAVSLIEDRLPPGEEVQAVYVVGNASQYPLVHRTILAQAGGLPIRFLEPKATVSNFAGSDHLKAIAPRAAVVMGTVTSARKGYLPESAGAESDEPPGRLRVVKNPRDLKNSVAQGALRLLQARKQALGFGVKCDNRLMDRLPFDIKMRVVDKPIPLVLFHEGTLYSELPPRTIVIERPAEGRAATEDLTLYRSWPGDVEDEEYLRFHSSEPLFGSYRIAYAQSVQRFTLQLLVNDQPKGQPIVGFTRDNTFRNAPVQVGELAWPAVKI